jgi:hypothetical protein
LTVAEEVVAVEQIEAEVEELAEHRSHTQMDATKKPPRLRFLLLNLLPGRHLLPANHGMLLRRATIAGILPNLLKSAGASPRVQLLKQLRRRPQASSLPVSRRAGQACLQHLLLLQRKHRSQSLRSLLHRIFLHRYLLTLSLDLQNPRSQKHLSSYLKSNPKFLLLNRLKSNLSRQLHWRLLLSMSPKLRLHPQPTISPKPTLNKSLMPLALYPQQLLQALLLVLGTLETLLRVRPHTPPCNKTSPRQFAHQRLDFKLRL